MTIFSEAHIQDLKQKTEHIESAVQCRDVKVAKELISRFLRQEKNSDLARYLASEYFRRLSDFGAALRVLPPECEINYFEKLTDGQLQNQLQLVRILNLLGASARALKILSSIPNHIKKKQSQQVTGVLVSNYWYQDAIPWSQAIESKSDEQLTYSERMQLISLADCYFGSSDIRRAQELLKRIIRISSEPAILGVALRSLGAHYILSLDLKNAETSLIKAAEISPSADQSNDRGLLEKWIGALECLKGNISSANDRLSRAWGILFRPGTKPEVWLEACFWRGLCKFKEDRSRLPYEWARLSAYPSSSNRMVQMISQFTQLPSQLIFGHTDILSEPANLHIDLAADVLSLRDMRGKCQWQLGVNTAQRLLHFLTIAGDYGLPQYRAYEALWPDEPFSFGQHQKRIEQLVIQLRRKGVPLTWANTHLTLGPGLKHTHSTLWAKAEKFRGEPFLEGRSEFVRTDVEAFFGISKRTAGYLVEEWMVEKIVCQSGLGKALKYNILKHS